MPRSVPEWKGKTDDSKVPARVRLRVFDRFKGVCQLSFRPIRAGEEWQAHHVIGLDAGGENRESNLVPVLTAPHQKESKRQQAVKKKVNATRKKHLGITKPKQKIQSPGFQTSRKKARIEKPDLPPKQLFRSV